MNERLRRFLLIAGFILVVAGMVFAIYWVFFRGQPTTPGVKNANTGNINGLPPISNGNTNRTPTGNINGLPLTNTSTGPSRFANGGATIAEPVTTVPTSGPTVSTNGDLVYYDRPTGKFFRQSSDGTNKSVLTDAVYRDVETITWDPNGTKAVLTFPDDSKVLYDFNQKKQYTLPRELNEFSFSPNGDQLASKYLDAQHPDNQWLMVSRPDGTGAQSIEQLGENARKVTTSWSPNNSVIATFEQSTNASSSEIIFLGKSGENLPSAQVDGRGFIPNWSPDGNRVLYSTYSDVTDNAPHLYLMDGSADRLGQNILDLNLDTRADKCVFSQDNHTVFCAVPYYPVSNSGPQPSLAFSVPDNIYSIDLLRGSATLVARPVDGSQRQRFSMGSIKLSTDESTLYFTDTQTGYLHRLLLR